MKKKYYKIILRMGEWVEKGKVGYPLYYSDGYVTIKDDYLEGYLTDDYINGTIQKDNSIMKVFSNYFDINTKENKYKRNIIYYEFRRTSQKLEGSGNYIWQDNVNEYIFASITSAKEIVDCSRQKKIDAQLEQVKKEYQNPFP